jgi:hypothetical protein
MTVIIRRLNIRINTSEPQERKTGQRRAADEEIFKRELALDFQKGCALAGRSRVSIPMPFNFLLQLT